MMPCADCGGMHNPLDGSSCTPELDELREENAELRAERDRWAARVKLLEARLNRIGAVAAGRGDQ
jgi:hypothetical protein